MSLVYRIQKRQFVDSVLTGEGARLNLKNSPSRNILINPLHPLIGRVKVVEVIPHEFDDRLRR